MSIRLNTADDEFLNRSKNGTVWGRIYFENNDQFFPEQSWTDMVVPFLHGWLEALVKIATGSSTEETVRFMDGPFRVALSASDKGVVELSLIHKDSKEQSARTTIEDLLQNGVTISGRILTACRRRGWSDHDRDTKMLADVTNLGMEVLGRRHSH